MKTTIETINGKLCTVIRRKFCAEKARESLAMGVPVVAEGSYGIVAIDWINAETNYAHFVHDPSPRGYESSPDEDRGDIHFNDFKSILTILPALPRKPTKEDAPLLYRYASEGLYPAFDNYQFAHMDDDGQVYVYGNAGLDFIHDVQTTHAVTADGQRVEVAIV